MLAREDVVSDGEAGVSRDHAVVRAGDGHAGPAQPPTKSGPRYEMRRDGGRDRRRARERRLPAVVLVDPVAAPRHGGGRRGWAARGAGGGVAGVRGLEEKAKWSSAVPCVSLLSPLIRFLRGLLDLGGLRLHRPSWAEMDWAFFVRGKHKAFYRARIGAHSPTENIPFCVM